MRADVAAYHALGTGVQLLEGRFDGPGAVPLEELEDARLAERVAAIIARVSPSNMSGKRELIRTVR